MWVGRACGAIQSAPDRLRTCMWETPRWACCLPEEANLHASALQVSDTYDECVFRDDTLVLLEMTTRDMMEVQIDLEVTVVVQSALMFVLVSHICPPTRLLCWLDKVFCVAAGWRPPGLDLRQGHPNGRLHPAHRCIVDHGVGCSCHCSHPLGCQRLDADVPPEASRCGGNCLNRNNGVLTAATPGLRYTVLLSNFRRYFKLASYISTHTNQSIVIAMGVPSLRVTARSWHMHKGQYVVKRPCCLGADLQCCQFLHPLCRSCFLSGTMRTWMAAS